MPLKRVYLMPGQEGYVDASDLDDDERVFRLDDAESEIAELLEEEKAKLIQLKQKDEAIHELKERLQDLQLRYAQQVEWRDQETSAGSVRERDLVSQKARVQDLQGVLASLQAQVAGLWEREAMWAEKLMDESVKSRRAAEEGQIQTVDALMRVEEAERDLAAATVMNQAQGRELIALRAEVGKLGDKAWGKEFELHAMELRLQEMSRSREGWKVGCAQWSERYDRRAMDYALEKEGLRDKIAHLQKQLELESVKRQRAGDVVDASGRRKFGRRALMEIDPNDTVVGTSDDEEIQETVYHKAA